jgi:hypothetical protein
MKGKPRSRRTWYGTGVKEASAVVKPSKHAASKRPPKPKKKVQVTVAAQSSKESKKWSRDDD